MGKSFFIIWGGGDTITPVSCCSFSDQLHCVMGSHVCLQPQCENIASVDFTGSDLILAGRACKGCLMGVRGVGGVKGCVDQMELLEHSAAHTKRPRNLRTTPSSSFPSQANTDISAETAPRAAHAWADVHTHKHRPIKQHMLRFLLPGAAGGTPLPTEPCEREEGKEGGEERRGGPCYCWTHKGTNTVVIDTWASHCHFYPVAICRVHSIHRTVCSNC